MTRFGPDLGFRALVYATTVFIVFSTVMWWLDPLPRPGTPGPDAAIETMLVIGAVIIAGVLWMVCWFSAFSQE